MIGANIHLYVHEVTQIFVWLHMFVPCWTLFQATALRNGNALCDGISNSNWVGQRPRPSKCVKPSPHWKGMKDLETMWCIWSENGETFVVDLEFWKSSRYHFKGCCIETGYLQQLGLIVSEVVTQPVVTPSCEESMEGTPIKPAKARPTTLRKIPRGVEWMPRKWMCLVFFGGDVGWGHCTQCVFCAQVVDWDLLMLVQNCEWMILDVDADVLPDFHEQQLPLLKHVLLICTLRENSNRIEGREKSWDTISRSLSTEFGFCVIFFGCHREDV